MNHNQYTKLRTLAERLHLDYFNFSPFYNYDDIKRLWENAVYCNKIQNNLKKEGYNTDVVRTYHLFCEDRKEIIEFALRAERNLSRMDYFILNICDLACVSYQVAKKALTEFKR